MKRFLSILAAVMIAILAVVPMIGASAETQMYVSSSNGKGVNLRAQPTKASTLICKLGEGKVVTVLSNYNSEWALIQATVNGCVRTGYAMRQFLSTNDPANARQSFRDVTPFEVVVTPTRGASGNLNMRDGASTRCTILRKLYQGDILTVTAESRAWYRVIDDLGNVGYVVKSSVQK